MLFSVEFTWENCGTHESPKSGFAVSGFKLHPEPSDYEARVLPTWQQRSVSEPIINKEFWEELIAYFPWYDTSHIENDASNNSSIVAYVFVTSVAFLPSRWLATIRGFLPSRCLATKRKFFTQQLHSNDGGIHRHAHTQTATSFHKPTLFFSKLGKYSKMWITVQSVKSQHISLLHRCWYKFQFTLKLYFHFTRFFLHSFSPLSLQLQGKMPIFSHSGAEWKEKRSPHND
jgi:hypothetical protein